MVDGNLDFGKIWAGTEFLARKSMVALTVVSHTAQPEHSVSGRRIAIWRFLKGASKFLVLWAQAPVNKEIEKIL